MRVIEGLTCAPIYGEASDPSIADHLGGNRTGASPPEEAEPRCLPERCVFAVVFVFVFVFAVVFVFVFAVPVPVPVAVAVAVAVLFLAVLFVLIHVLVRVRRGRLGGRRRRWR
ncbi:MAG: hypothetical protein ACXWXG_03220 [Actinomycetota bacterium]